MADIPQSLRYEKLASGELDAASVAHTPESRNAHLNEAAVYAVAGERVRPESPHSAEVTDLICRLSAVLTKANHLHLTAAAIHVNDATLALGGTGISPPQ